MPDGTVVMTPDGEVLADLVGPGTRFVAAAGGRGGLGNAALASAARKAPGFALLGEPGETREFVLELRSIADVGLVGFPSAGKSSLVAALSAARPKIADYPFTTLVPQLGVVTAGEEVFTVADVPGLIPGASEGRGLGLDFLRHIERCSVLVHVVDCATFEPGRDPVSDMQALEDELARYTPALGGELADRPRLVALNKIDVPDARELAELVRRRAGGALRLAGVRDLDGDPGGAARADLRDGRAGARAPGGAARRRADPGGAAARRPSTTPASPSSPTRSCRAGSSCAARGPERWIRQTNFDNDEAVGYLGDRLARLGVEEALAAAGAVPGCPVTIGDVTFDWEPSTPAGVAVMLSGRGTDRRLDQSVARVGGGPAGRRASSGAGATPTTSCSAGGDTAPERRHVTCPGAARGGAPGRGQGRVVVADQPDRRTGPGAARRARRRAGRAPRGGYPGRAGVVRGDRGGLAPLGLARRPRDLATQQAAAAVGQLLLAADLRARRSPATARPSARCCSPRTT